MLWGLKKSVQLVIKDLANDVVAGDININR